ncbi:HIT-like protein [Epithele typhae]|uniref:HIT-like protein n=1 Tax=Epithele typhae TaxID=378194 RepID=UPI002008C342|nr:HIT-like protein [Epithele typhae]KAH9924687.1 HIT-like protein [Epithele typhae]
MTSYVLKAHEGRPVPEAWRPPVSSTTTSNANCPFCGIVAGTMPAYRVYETDAVVAILDIAPLRPGHTLVIPKTHVSRVSELEDDFAAECGRAVSKVARAIAAGLRNTALNVVCNQEYAQAVPHVHYHIIPAPRPEGEASQAASTPGRLIGIAREEQASKPLTENELHWREFEARHELGPDDAQSIVKQIRAHL